MPRIWKENMPSHEINSYTTALNAKQIINNEYKEIDMNDLYNHSFDDISINTLWNYFKKSKDEK